MFRRRRETENDHDINKNGFFTYTFSFWKNWKMLREEEILIIEDRQRTIGYYRRKTWQLLSTRASKYRHFTTNKYSRAIEILVFLVLITNVAYALQYIAEPLENTEIRQNWIHILIQTPTAIIFDVEYLLRFWSCVESSSGKDTFLTRFKWLSKPLSVLDLGCCVLCTINLPALFMKKNIAHFNKIVAIRVLLLLRLERQLKAFKRIWQILSTRLEEMLLATFFTACCVLYSGLVFFLIERKDEDSMNLGNATYWGVQTITALGYGDIVPTTVMSKVLACFVSLLGIVVLAIPTGIVSSTFIDLSNEERRRNRQGETSSTTTKEAIGKLSHDVEVLSSEIKALCDKVDNLVTSDPS